MDEIITGNIKMYLCTIDLDKAFDTLRRKKIWKAPERKGVWNALIQAI